MAIPVHGMSLEDAPLCVTVKVVCAGFPDVSTPEMVTMADRDSVRLLAAKPSLTLGVDPDLSIYAEVIHVEFSETARVARSILVQLIRPDPEVTAAATTISSTEMTPGSTVSAGSTVTAQLAVKPPSAVVTIMVAEPVATPVTTPDWLTVATEAFDVDHVTDLFVALEGETLADSVAVDPALTVKVDLFSDTPVTDTVEALTVTAHEAYLPLPSVAVALIVADPVPTAVTWPDWFTTATEVLDDDQLTVLLVALAGRTVAVKGLEDPGVRDKVDLFSDTEVTGTFDAEVPSW